MVCTTDEDFQRPKAIRKPLVQQNIRSMMGVEGVQVRAEKRKNSVKRRTVVDLTGEPGQR